MLTSVLEETPQTTCPFTFHAQIHSVEVPEYLMQELEAELQQPTGVWTVPPPKLTISGVLLSKECGILYQLTNTEGLRYVMVFQLLPDSNFVVYRSRTFYRKVTTCEVIQAFNMLYTKHLPRCRIDGYCLSYDVDSFLSTKRTKSYTIGYLAGLLVDIPLTIDHGCRIFRWSHHFCDSGGR